MLDTHFQSNRAFLKAATREAHTEAERTWVGSGSFSDLDTYRAWLTAMLNIHQSHGLPAAQRLSGCWDAEFEHQRMAALRVDLGVGPAPAAEIDGMSESWAWGVQYVLNGSALGASVLLKTNRVDPNWPRAYLHEMQTFARAGHLKRFFDLLDARQIDCDEAQRGAEAAFSVFSHKVATSPRAGKAQQS